MKTREIICFKIRDWLLRVDQSIRGNRLLTRAAQGDGLIRLRGDCGFCSDSSPKFWRKGQSPEPRRGVNLQVCRASIRRGVAGRKGSQLPQPDDAPWGRTNRRIGLRQAWTLTPRLAPVWLRLVRMREWLSRADQSIRANRLLGRGINFSYQMSENVMFSGCFSRFLASRIDCRRLVVFFQWFELRAPAGLVPHCLTKWIFFVGFCLF